MLQNHVIYDSCGLSYPYSPSEHIYKSAASGSFSNGPNGKKNRFHLTLQVHIPLSDQVEYLKIFLLGHLRVDKATYYLCGFFSDISIFENVYLFWYILPQVDEEKLVH